MVNPFAEAAANGGALVADFLTGRASGAYPGGELEHILPTLVQAFGGFCDKHGISSEDYAALLVRFTAGHRGNRFHRNHRGPSWSPKLARI